MLRIFFCLTLAVTLLNACTIEKRTFRKGWHVEWKQRHETVKDASEKHVLTADIRPAAEIGEAAVPVDAETPSELVTQMAVAEEKTVQVETAREHTITDAIGSAEAVQQSIAPVISSEKAPDPEQPDDVAPISKGWWWMVALLVGIALASAIWLAVGTGGSGGLLVALFVALIGSVVGASVLSMRIKKSYPKEQEEDIQFDDLTEAEIQRKKKMKGLIAVLVLLVAGVVIIVVGSK